MTLVSSRREWLQRSGLGFGSVALASLLAGESHAATRLAIGGEEGKPSPAPKAKRIIQVFLEGGLSQMDSLDPKPELTKRNGEVIKPSDSGMQGTLYGSPFTFAQHGQSGIAISDLFPHLAKHADDLCVIRSMHTDNPAHELAMMMMNCGEMRMARPSVGSWINYGLGSENEDLPGFISLYSYSPPLRGPENWQAAFLPGMYQGTGIDAQYKELDKLIENIRSPQFELGQQREQLDLLGKLNQAHVEQSRHSDKRLEARIQAFELAFRMQTAANDAFDLSSEPAATWEAYGETDSSRKCVLARRLAERDVRFIQVYCGQWDHHYEIESGIRSSAEECDQAIGALLADLKQRGLLDDTLVVCCGEFGRTPVVDTNAGASGKSPGRDHNHRGFSIWMAGGGVKKGCVYGATDEFGWDAIENKVHVHDLHATMLHLLGLDHTQLTYRYAGRDFRLTDVHGHVVHEIIA
jgi:hypothetical protein